MTTVGRAAATGSRSCFDLLSGVRVLDCSRLIIGDLATARLADLGADVVKVRAAGIGDALSSLPPLVAGISLRYLLYNTNKRALYLDSEDRSLSDELSRCDAVVVLGNPASLDAAGLGYEALCGARPDLVYCAITPYGTSGPYRDLPAHGGNIDAAAGYGRLAADGFAVGGLFAANHAATAILAGLWRRARTGQGARIEVSCWAAALEANVAFWSHLNGVTSGRDHALAPEELTSPAYGVFSCGDGRPVFLAIVTMAEWRRFCAAAGDIDLTPPDEPEDPAGWLTGGGDRSAVARLLEGTSRDEWMARFIDHRVPASPVFFPHELASDNPELVGRVRSAVEVAGQLVWLPSSPVVVDGEAIEARHFEPIDPPSDHGSDHSRNEAQ